jgi:uncharacterized protein involved in response to NO
MRAPRTPAFTVFCPAAAIYAALIVPLSLLALQGLGPAALAGSAGHGYEMLFGFALAVVAGYLLGPLSRRTLALIFTLWLLARAAQLVLPWSAVSLALNGVFVLLLARQLVPRFLAAKKWRNQAISPLLAAICLGALAVAAAAFSGELPLQQTLLRESVLLFALLMLFMGGRVIAPAAAGEFDRRGELLEARVQPRLEGMLILMPAAALLLAPLPGGAWASGLLIAGSGAVAAIRLWRWRLWHCGARPDLICLGVGYGWLALGLVLLGASKVAGFPVSAALHVITVGALGTLSSGIMARVALQRSKRAPARAPALVVMAGLIGVAALARGGAVFAAELAFPLLWLAALAWSGAFVLLSVVLVRARASGRSVAQPADLRPVQGRPGV